MHDRLSWKLLVIAALAVIGFTLAGGLVVRGAMNDAKATQLRADLAPLNLANAELREALRDARIKPNARNSAALKVAAQASRQAADDAQKELELPESLRRTIDETIAALAPAEALVRQEGAAPFLLKAGDAADRLSAAIEAVSNLDTRLAVGEVLAVDNAADIQEAIVARALSTQSVLTPDQRTQLETTLPTDTRTIHEYEEFVKPELAQRLNELTTTPSATAFNDIVSRVLAAKTPADFGVTPQQFDAVSQQYEIDRGVVADELRESIAQTAAQEARASVVRAWATSGLIVIAIIVVIALTVLLGSDIIRQQRRTTALNAALDLRADKLARSNADLQNFAHAASHDLKEPLRMVTMVTSRLTDAYPVGAEIDERAVTYLTSARTNSERMTVLLADLLSYAQTAQSDPSKFGFVDVAEVIAQSWESNGARVLETDASLVVPTTLPTLPHASALLLGQVFANLFSNALKYRKTGVAPLIEVSVEREVNCWRFNVSDNGIGIEPQYREQIFEIFKRLHGPSEYEGTGVGLALVKNIVTAHGGTINVTANTSGGSTFTFTICDATPLS